MSNPKQQNAVTQYLTKAIEESGLTQTEIADKCGFERSTMVSMMKCGRAQVPFNQIKPLAKALGVDHLEFAELVIGEYDPGLMGLVGELADRRL